MTLFIVKYALPALLGYALFVGIAGKFNPLVKPVVLEERPSWMLGLWTGMSVFLVLCIGLHMAYGMTLDAVRSLALPSTIGIFLLLGCCLVGYFRYQKKVLGEISELEAERDLRKETEQHLRITRKALSTALEPQPSSAHEHEATVPHQHSLELNVANLKRELVKAKQEIRLHVAARAKALSTANKSVAFARQSIELRARLETELETAHAALASRQTTIASLVSKLEHERRLTDDELAVLASHLAANDPKRKPTYSDQTAS